ncbi:general stress protein [Pseudochelatococcus contaminans]|uniref:Low temperature-induced protein n=1 Tax=Pseudochelatococcus contaminans TaxID=1538103 RepID=A0A7W5Z4C5_9HYPH|nr:general stress protein [Pseudochelatococcus contaminans]MBB3809936.1 hypothetical protein [Pseudochelatococcus contaminans]
MPVVTGLFDTYEDARKAVEALKAANVDVADISIISPEELAGSGERAVEGAGAGIGIGALIGGVGGVIAGLSVVAIPVVAAGWLAAALAGAAGGAVVGGLTGGLIGGLTESGVSVDDAKFYAEAVSRGGTLVAARVDEGQVEAVAAIYRSANGVDPDARRQLYAQGA